jgi:hypothetical protein
MTRYTRALLGALILLLPMSLALGGGAQAASAQPVAVQGAAAKAKAANPIPGFEVFCFHSHSAMADPIISPGRTSMHLHDFAGNTTTNANSTVASLRAGTSNCKLKADTASYWAPALYSHGRKVTPDRLHAYYRWGQINDYAKIKPIPAGLKMVAGNAMAKGPQSTKVIGWNCGVQGATLYDHPISCRSGQKIVLHAFFPNCWDGKRLDSPDHTSHMAYSYHGSCPKTHPVSIPRLSEDYGYPIQDGTGITLASGSYNTAHADFWNTWNQSKMEQLTRDCINKGRQCGPQEG